jgi:hypothetical protein
MRGVQDGEVFTCVCGEKMPIDRAQEHQCRNFEEDFCAPALKGLTRAERDRIGIALDTAIIFGVLEYVKGNESLHDQEALRQRYWFNVGRLKVAP